MTMWVTSHGQPNAANDGYFNVDQIQSLSCGPFEDGFCVSLAIEAGPDEVLNIYEGIETLEEAQAKTAALAAATGIIVT